MKKIPGRPSTSKSDILPNHSSIPLCTYVFILKQLLLRLLSSNRNTAHFYNKIQRNYSVKSVESFVKARAHVMNHKMDLRSHCLLVVPAQLRRSTLWLVEEYNTPFPDEMLTTYEALFSESSPFAEPRCVCKSVEHIKKMHLLSAVFSREKNRERERLEN